MSKRTGSTKTRVCAGRSRQVIVVSLVLTMIAAAGAFAQWTGIGSLHRQQATEKSGQVTTQSFAPSSPSKEYVYAGGRLVATEEPAGTPAPPPGPTGLVATPGNAQVLLTWDVAPGATSYNVKRSTTNGGPYSTVAPGVTGTSYNNNTGLTNGITYYYVVSGSNTAGEGPNSVQVSATPTSGPTPPPAPTGLAATPGNAQVSLTWNAASGATSYNVKRATTNGGPYSTIAPGVTGTSYNNNSGLTNGITYYYVVSGSNTAGEGPNSSQVSATPTSGPTPPPAPTGLAATPGNAQVSLTWNAASGATSYNVKRATTNGGPYSTIAPGVTGTSYNNNTGLTNGITYYYVVSASNSAGESANSTQVSATPTSGGGGAPTLSNMSPATAIQGASFTLTINGSNLAGATSVNLSPPDDVTITNINSTAVQVTCAVSIGATAATGGRLLTVTTASGGTSTNFLVFAINSSSPAPTISSISPAKKAQGTTFTLTISGTNLSQTTSVNFSPSTGITVSNIVANSTQVTATISISANAGVGIRQVSVTTPAGTSNTKSFTVN